MTEAAVSTSERDPVAEPMPVRRAAAAFSEFFPSTAFRFVLARAGRAAYSRSVSACCAAARTPASGSLAAISRKAASA